MNIEKSSGQLPTTAKKRIGTEASQLVGNLGGGGTRRKKEILTTTASNKALKISGPCGKGKSRHRVVDIIPENSRGRRGGRMLRGKNFDSQR